MGRGIGMVRFRLLGVSVFSSSTLFLRLIKQKLPQQLPDPGAALDPEHQDQEALVSLQ